MALNSVSLSTSAPAMPSRAVPSAATRVFQVTELLEQILQAMFDNVVGMPSEEAVSMRSLLRCKRVSRIFKAVVEGSVLLQNQLWYSHGSSVDESWHYGDVHFNPLFSEPRTSCMKYFPLEMSVSTLVDVQTAIWIHKAVLEDSDGSWRQMRLFRLNGLPWEVSAYGHSGHFLRYLNLKSDTTAGEFIDDMRDWLN